MLNRYRNYLENLEKIDNELDNLDSFDNQAIEFYEYLKLLNEKEKIRVTKLLEIEENKHIPKIN